MRAVFEVLVGSHKRRHQKTLHPVSGSYSIFVHWCSLFHFWSDVELQWNDLGSAGHVLGPGHDLTRMIVCNYALRASGPLVGAELFNLEEDRHVTHNRYLDLQKYSVSPPHPRNFCLRHPRHDSGAAVREARSWPLKNPDTVLLASFGPKNVRRRTISAFVEHGPSENATIELFHRFWAAQSSQHISLPHIWWPFPRQLEHNFVTVDP